MKRTVLLAPIIAAVLATTAVLALGRRSTTPPLPVTKTLQYRCTDRNQSLYFLVYEVDGKLDRGLMYVENMQVANMSVEQAGTLHQGQGEREYRQRRLSARQGGTIMVANHQTSNRVEVCKASYKYQ